jgi:hypothetical protein
MLAVIDDGQEKEIKNRTLTAFAIVFFPLSGCDSVDPDVTVTSRHFRIEACQLEVPVLGEEHSPC